MNRKQSAFTLVEILIVVVILGILAAIVIPQFTDAGNDARASALKSDLQTVRSQLALYKVQHLDSYPAAATFVTQMTTKTDSSGAAGGTLGAYLQTFPANPYNNLSTVEVESGTAGLGNGSHGWHFDTATGMFAADDSAEHGAW
ncbi:MAG: prepilin-type N-terminal cleavage/methylation domain-containing protein [Planctomycetaceae bacterium]|nr:prepilin-type N-terminal cleavage/methylation domain-containing protein [Planctomycetaceae bacterium]